MPERPETLTGLSFRPLLRGDLPLLHSWLLRPHVTQWWRDVPANFAAVEAECGACIDGDDPTELFVISRDGRPVGMIQRYLIADEPEWWPAFEGICDVRTAAGIDYLIGEPDLVGRGIGSAVIATFSPLVFEWRAVDSIVVTAQQAP